MSDQQIEPLDIPRDRAASWLRRFPVAAIALLTTERGLPVVELLATRDLEIALIAAARRWPKDTPPLVGFAAWAGNLIAAQRITTLCIGNDLRGVPRDGLQRLSVPLSVAVAAIESAAQRLGVPLTPHQRILQAAQLGGGGIVKSKQFNRQYRANRLAAAARGEKNFPSYAVARDQFIAES